MKHIIVFLLTLVFAQSVMALDTNYQQVAKVAGITEEVSADNLEQLLSGITKDADSKELNTRDGAVDTADFQIMRDFLVNLNEYYDTGVILFFSGPNGISYAAVFSNFYIQKDDYTPEEVAKIDTHISTEARAILKVVTTLRKEGKEITTLTAKAVVQETD